MELAVRHAVTYATSRDTPVQLVADSLLANERLLIEALRIFARSTPGLEISSIAVKVAELSNSSPLREVLVAALVVTYQKDLVEAVPSLIEAVTGIHVPDKFSSLVTLIVVATALYTINAAIERLMPGKSARKLKEEYEHKIDRVSEISGISKETIERYIAARQTSEPSLFKKSVSFFAPARLDPGAAILLPNGETIDAATIEEIPLDLEIELFDEEMEYELRGVVVDIHRSDRDETKHGWRAVIESVSSRKVRMELDSAIEPESLYGRKMIVGDVRIKDGRLQNGETGPVMYRLIRVSNGTQENL